MTNSTEANYWLSTSNSGFNFDDEDDTDLNVHIDEEFNFSNSDSVFGSGVSETTASNTLPIYSIINTEDLKTVLNDVNSTDYVNCPLIGETVLKMFLGLPFNLYVYRSLDKKFELLDEAVSTQDGNVILAVLSFLEKTLNCNTLYHHLVNRKVALQHYKNYLFKRLQLDRLANLYMYTENSFDVINLFYIGCTEDSSKEYVSRKVSRFLQEHQFKLSPGYVSLLENYQKFLDWQSQNKMSSDTLTKQLAALLYNQCNENEANAISKTNCAFKDHFKIGDFQYEWILLNVLASCKKWNALKTVFLKSNWLTKKHLLKSSIEASLFVSCLKKHDAPIDILEEFIKCVSDRDTALELGKELKCHKFVIDVLANQKDFDGLCAYKQVLENSSEHFLYAENAILSIRKK